MKRCHANSVSVNVLFRATLKHDPGSEHSEFAWKCGIFMLSEGKGTRKTAQEQTGQEKKSVSAKPAEGFCLSGRIPQVSHPIIIIIRSV